MDIKNRFAYMMKTKRIEKGISQAKLASVVGSSKHSIILWESARKNIGFEKALEISRYLNFSLDDLNKEESKVERVEALGEEDITDWDI